MYQIVECFIRSKTLVLIHRV